MTSPASPTTRRCARSCASSRRRAHVRHEAQGQRYIYLPAVPRHAARKSALKHLVETFFDGSAEQTVAALLGGEGSRLSGEDLDRIGRLIDKARKDGSR